MMPPRNRPDNPIEMEETIPLGYERTLDLEQSFDFRLDRQSAIGFIASLTIGGTQIQPELGMFDPTLLGSATASATAAIGVAASRPSVGALSQIAWELGDADPIRFEARISARAKQQILLAQYAQKLVIDVTVAWVVYEYDQVTHKYYVAFANSASGNASGSPAQGQLLKKGRNLELRVGSGLATEVSTPPNFSLYFAIVPKQQLKQELYLATGPLLRLTKPWGRVRAA